MPALVWRAGVRPVSPVDEAVAREARAALDGKTKPRGSLGRLEDLAVRVAGVRGTASPAPLAPVVVVAAGDHGVADEGVSAYPQEVTGQMLANFEAGGAAVAVLCRHAGARLVVVDAGVVEPAGGPGVLDLSLGAGTGERRRRAGDGARGRRRGSRARSSARTAAGRRGCGGGRARGDGDRRTRPSPPRSRAPCSGCDPRVACGRGTGLDDAGVEHKIAVVDRMLDRQPRRSRTTLSARSRASAASSSRCSPAWRSAAAGGRAVVLLDGFIYRRRRSSPRASRRRCATTSSRRIARPSPGIGSSSTRSGSSRCSSSSCGWGRGAARRSRAAARAARAILVEMATFESAGVTDTGR